MEKRSNDLRLTVLLMRVLSVALDAWGGGLWDNDQTGLKAALKKGLLEQRWELHLVLTRVLVGNV